MNMPESLARSWQSISPFSPPPPPGPSPCAQAGEQLPTLSYSWQLNQTCFSEGNQNACLTPSFGFLLFKHKIASTDSQKIQLVEEKRAKLLIWILFKITNTVLMMLSHVPMRKWSHFEILRSLESPRWARCYDIPSLLRARNIIFLLSFPEN